MALPRLQPAPQMGFLSVNGGGVSWVPEPTGFPLSLSVGKWGRCRRRGGCRWRGKAKDRSVPFLSLCSWALNWGLGGGMPPGNEASTSTYITLTPHRHPTPARKPRAG